MTLTIDFPPAILDKLREQAKLSGTGVNEIVIEAVMTHVQRRHRTLREILEPVHKEIEASGISDEELDEMFERELAVVRTRRKLQ